MPPDLFTRCGFGGWKASPQFLTMLADAERDAQDELEDFP
jgi:hypothetical protein